MSSNGRAVVVVAGRRVDAPGTKDPRFPAGKVDTVKAAIAALLRDRRATDLIASAACGADIVALEAAAKLDMKTHIILPFARERFRKTSVVDRGESWGPRFDAVMDRADDVLVVEIKNGTDDEAYAVVTARLIAEARALAEARSAAALALAVWDANPRAQNDATQDFIDKANQAGVEVHTISTL